MASNQVFKVDSDFDLEKFVNSFVSMYHMQGMVQSHTNTKNNHFVDINQSNEGFTKYIGLGANIRVAFVLDNDLLHISFSEADWTGKIVAYLLVPFTCSITLITGLIGVFKQLKLPKKVKDDILRLLSSGQIEGMNPFAGNRYAPNASNYHQGGPSPNTGTVNNQIQRFCTNCGAGISDKAGNCPNCGESV